MKELVKLLNEQKIQLEKKDKPNNCLIKKHIQNSGTKKNIQNNIKLLDTIKLI